MHIPCGGPLTSVTQAGGDDDGSICPDLAFDIRHAGRAGYVALGGSRVHGRGRSQIAAAPRLSAGLERADGTLAADIRVQHRYHRHGLACDGTTARAAARPE